MIPARHPPLRVVLAALALFLTGSLVAAAVPGATRAAPASPSATQAQEPSADTLRPAARDSVEALAAFHANIAAIHARDRAAYLSAYLQSPRLVRSGPEGPATGYEEFARDAGIAWPDTLVASHLRVTPVADGVVHGSYHYRVVQDGSWTRGVSERVLLRTDEGWKVGVTTAFPSPPDQPPPPFVLVGGTLIDGTGRDPVPNAVVVLRDGEVACAGDRDRCPVPEDAEAVDASGHWIIPGLVDAHVHFSQSGWADGRPDALDLRAEHPYPRAVSRLRDEPEPFFQGYLCAGVTSAFDVGGFPWSWELRDRARAHPSAPRVRAAGPLLSTRDHWLNLPGERQFLHMSDRDVVRQAADYLLTSGTDAVKVWYLRVDDEAEAERQREYLNLAGQWARDAGVPLIVHATHLEGAREAVGAGASLLVHSVEDQVVDDDFLHMARRSGVVYTPTLTVYEGYDELRLRKFDEDRTQVECVDPHTLELARSTRRLSGAPDAETRQALQRRAADRAQLLAENLRRIHDAGIPVAVGTDAGNPLTLHGPAIYREMEAMQDAGLEPMEVLVAATRGGARAMGVAEIAGTMEPAKAADLVVLEQDPLDDVANVRSVRMVVRGGEIFTRDELTFRHAP